jgi:hypothetical protein
VYGQIKRLVEYIPHPLKPDAAKMDFGMNPGKWSFYVSPTT